MKRILATLLALLCAVAPLAAFAEMQAEATLVYASDGVNSDTPTLHPYANLFTIWRPSEPTKLYNANGELIDTPDVRYFYFPSNQPSTLFHVESTNLDATNNKRILDSCGQVISIQEYAHVEYLSDKWTAGLVMEPVSRELSDGYANRTGQLRILSADMYYNGSYVATISRKEFKEHHVFGDFIYFKDPKGVLNSTGELLPISDPAYSYWNEFSTNSAHGEGIWHWGSSQMLFTPSCTLTADAVTEPILYDGNGNFIDLQGNILFSNKVFYNGGHRDTIELIQNRYIIVASVGSIHYMFDLQGNVIARGTDLGDLYNNNHGAMATGYQLYEALDGTLHYVDIIGQETHSFAIPSHASVSSSCMLYNLPFLFYQNPETGLYSVITAAAGLLPTEYESIHSEGYEPRSPLLGVKKDGKVGVIDLYGNTVIDFQYQNMQMSNDGTLLIMIQNSYYPSTCHIYRIDYTDPAAEEAARLEAEAAAQAAAEAAAAEEAARLEAEAAAQAAAEAAAAEEAARLEAEAAAWHCDACDRDNDLNFCPGCGAARPVPPPVCSSCGYEAPDASYRFCPSCGQAF